MRIAAAVLTYNAISTGRVDLLKRAIVGLLECGQVYVYDNGSTDGTGDFVRSLGGVVNDRPLHTSGYGTNMLARILAATDADVCVHSDDDMTWPEGWTSTVEAWWTDTPEDVWLTGLHIEPAYPWNQIGGTAEYGGVRALVRASTGAASWSYRRTDIPKIFPIPQQVQGWGDVPACERIGQHGGRIAQIHIADHAGRDQSTWGNKTIAKFGDDLAPVKALVA